MSLMKQAGARVGAAAAMLALAAMLSACALFGPLQDEQGGPLPTVPSATGQPAFPQQPTAQQFPPQQSPQQQPQFPQQSFPQQAGGPAAGGPGIGGSALSDYRLGPSDRLRVIVFGEDDLSDEFEVDSAGFVSLPLIGEVQAAGLTARQFETRIAQKYSEGYLLNPRVNAEVVTYRPFFIFGEVNEPGELPYAAGMNVIKAVSSAGGFTYRANQRRVFIRRQGEPEEREYRADPTVTVLPGDVIRVPERLF